MLYAIIVCILLFQDSKTKSGIEAKMTELNHRMSIEHRNRRKSHEYYRKLVEATKVGSKGRPVAPLLATFLFYDLCLAQQS